MRCSRLLFALLLVTSVSCGTAGSGGSPDASTAAGGGFDGVRAMAHVTELAATIGPRVPGSSGDSAAAAYIAGEFGKMKYGLIENTFTYEGNPNREATVAVSGATIGAVTAAGTTSGTVSGPAAWVGQGDTPLAAGSLAGKVAVATRGGGTFTNVHDAVTAAGATALVIINNESGTLAGRLAKPATVPVVGVQSGEQAALKSAADRGDVITVSVPEGQTISTENIIARPPNGDPCQIVIGAHYDTLAASQGANNNASGVAVLLELANQMRLPAISPRVCFVAFGGTVDGLRGSAAFVSHLPLSAPGGGVTAMVNLYGLGTGKSFVFFGDAPLSKDAKQAADGVGTSTRIAAATPGYSTDAKSFHAQAIPVLDFTSADFSANPNAADPAAGIDQGALTAAGRAMLALVRQLALQGGP